MHPPETRVDRSEKKVLALATGFVLAGLAVLAYATWGLGIAVPGCVPVAKTYVDASVARHDATHFEIHYVARMWGFQPTVVRIPTGATVDIYAVSKDVTHGLAVAGTNINLMVVPGAVANTQARFTRPGVYLVLCHEYCGVGHQNMSARIEVSDRFTDISADGLPSGAGAKLVEAKGCTACHSTDGSTGLGPTFKGMWGSTVTLASGQKRVVDADLLAQKINRPDSVAISGYPPLMPVLGLSPDEIAQIAAYLRTLR